MFHFYTLKTLFIYLFIKIFIQDGRFTSKELHIYKFQYPKSYIFTKYIKVTAFQTSSKFQTSNSKFQAETRIKISK